jgi:ComF family protein
MMYPSLCAACNRPLFRGEECVCTLCLYHLPRTGYHLETDNPVVRHFWGKTKVERATAYYYFSKGERVQRLIHHLKYKGRKDVGLFTGKMFGRELLQGAFEGIDLIVPVPLHPSRQRQRGYNQSDCLAEGIAEGMKKDVSFTSVYRKEATKTQTKKHRYERYKNVDNIFCVRNEEEITGKKILLVDDVITTGSTLISCADCLSSVKGVSVYIAAMACA